MDAFRWQVTYDDHEMLWELDHDLVGHGWAEVDVARVRDITLWPTFWDELEDGVDDEDEVGPKLIELVREPGDPRQIVFFRRRAIVVNPLFGDDQPQKVLTMTCVGLEGGPGSTYLFVTDDGSVVVTGDREYGYRGL